MKTPENILVPIDRSTYSLAALQYAEEISRIFQARITVVHILESDEEKIRQAGEKRPKPEAVEDQSRKLITHLLIDRGLATQSMKIVIRHGQPASEIIKAASEFHADLIVMSTHGRTGMRHVLVGSVAERVVRHSRCPVLTIKPEEFLELVDLTESEVTDSLHIGGLEDTRN